MRHLRWLFLALLAGCGECSTGPFYPDNPKRCDGDGKCPEHMHCGFPAVNTKSICLDGESDINTWEQGTP